MGKQKNRKKILKVKKRLNLGTCKSARTPEDLRDALNNMTIEETLKK